MFASSAPGFADDCKSFLTIIDPPDELSQGTAMTTFLTNSDDSGDPDPKIHPPLLGFTWSVRVRDNPTSLADPEDVGEHDDEGEENLDGPDDEAVPAPPSPPYTATVDAHEDFPDDSHNVAGPSGTNNH